MRSVINAGADILTDNNARTWAALAECFGYNELGRQVETLGEKVFCRLARDAAKKRLGALGYDLESIESEAEIMTIVRAGEGSAALPHITFYPRDIEQMREAVRRFDAGEAP